MIIGAEFYDHERVKKRLREIGWKPLPDHSRKQGWGDYVRWDLLEDMVRVLNRDLFSRLDSDEQESVLKQVRARFEEASSSEVLHLLKYGVQVEIMEGRTPVPQNIKVIDWNNWENNQFWFGHEVRFPGRSRSSEPDFTLFVNGIPLVIMELKRTRGKEEETYQYALSQIGRYERRSPRLFAFVQIGIAFGTQQVYIPTWAPYEDNDSRRKPLVWRRFNPETGKYEEEEDIWALLEPQTLLRVIRYYTYVAYEVKKVSEKKYEKGRMFRVIPRYMQFYTVERAIQRILAYLSNQDHKNRGLIWHWQGSGKSFEIYPFLSLQFMERFLHKNPHVFIVVDRRELEEQMWSKYMVAVNYNPGFSISIDRIESIKELKQVLAKIEEQSRNPNLTHSSVNLVLLHKFRYEELKEIQPIFKSEILILRDEVHRTEHGKLAEVLYSKFPNAIRIGFTGTPIIGKDERNARKSSTFEEYGYPQEGELYMDCFFISDSIRDGYTLPMVWREVKEKDIQIPDQEDIKKIVEEVLLSEEDYDEDLINIPKDEVRVGIRDFLIAENRIERAAEYIAEHVEEDTEGFLFKAFVVAESRYAAVLFYKFLVEKLRQKYGDEFSDQWVQVVMTGEGVLRNQKWQRVIEDFIELEVAKYGKQWNELIDTRKQMFPEKGTEPRILIVSDMLLQGYDAPILKVMYVYKLMRGTRLLQAIARTNRPAILKVGDNTIVKEHGLIVDLTGMLLSVFKHTIEKYNIFADQQIGEDVLRNIFESVEDRWSKFLTEFDNVRDMLNQALAPIELSYSKLKRMWNIMDDATKNTIIGYISQRNQSPTILEIINDLHRVVRSFEAIGVYPEKVDYYDDYEFMVSLLNQLKVRFFGKREAKKLATIDEVKQKALQRVAFRPFEDVGEQHIDDQFFKGKVPQHLILRTKIAHLISVTQNELEEKTQKSPLYEVLYERLQHLREQFLTGPEFEEDIENLQRLQNDLVKLRKEVKKVNKEVSSIPKIRQIANAVVSKHLSKINISKDMIRKISKDLETIIQSIEEAQMMQPIHKKHIKRILLLNLPASVSDASLIAEEMIETVEYMVNRYLLCGQEEI